MANASEDNASAEESNSPSVHVNYRVFEVEVQGGEGDSLEEVNAIANARIEDALEDIEDLKRTDFELDEEFDVNRQSQPNRTMSH